MNDQNLLSLVSRAVEIQDEDAQIADSIGYMARILVLTTLPHRDPGPVPAWGRRNGDFTLLIQPGAGMDKDGGTYSIGLPFGTYPRLLLAWICSEAVRTKSPELVLGNSLSAFMAKLGLDARGGPKGTIKPLRMQMNRLFSSHVSWAFEGQAADIRQAVTPVEARQIFWDPSRPEEVTLWRSTITLNQRFFTEVVTRPVPIDMRVVLELAERARSPLAMDIYTWLTYRLSRVTKPTAVTFAQLQAQLGSEYARERDFKVKFLHWLAVVQKFYPQAKFRLDDDRGRLWLFPSAPHVPRLAPGRQG